MVKEEEKGKGDVQNGRKGDIVLTKNRSATFYSKCEKSVRSFNMHYC